MTDNSNLLFNDTLEDQENSTKLLALSANLKNKISEAEGNNKIGTPRAKNVLSNRKVLAEKTPNNIKRHLVSPTRTSLSSPSLLNSSTPLAQHPSLKEIAATTKTLTNPPDLFLQPLQKRRSIRKSVEDKAAAKEETVTTTTSKLVVVFPTTSDELDLEEIEHAASSLVDDDDSLNCLSGTSKIIPNLELHENLDFSNLLSCTSETCVDNEQESEIVIEPIIVDFKLEDEEQK